MRLVLVDIGNSATKLAIHSPNTNVRGSESFSDSAGSCCLRLSHGQLPDLTTLSAAAHHWVIASVNPDQRDQLVHWLGRTRPQDSHRSVGYQDIALTINTDAPAEVGIDRLVAALAAQHGFGDTRRTAIVVDAGTAVTIDLVTADGTFQGGLIYPGPAAAFGQLNEQTAALPQLDYAARQATIAAWTDPQNSAASGHPWQSNTVDAITAGIFRNQIASLDRIVTDFVVSVAGDAAVFLTGGAIPELVRAGAAMNVLPDWIGRSEQRPHLVLEGLHRVASQLE